MSTPTDPRAAGRTARAAAAAAAAIALVLGTATATEARQRPRVELIGTGTWSADPWVTAVRAEVTGRPFGGTFTGGLRIDGLPAPGTCTDATMLSTVTRHDGRHHVGLLSVGELCGQHPQEGVSVVTATFTGEFDLYEASRRDLRDTQGFVEVRFTADGRTSVTLVG